MVKIDMDQVRMSCCEQVQRQCALEHVLGMGNPKVRNGQGEQERACYELETHCWAPLPWRQEEVIYVEDLYNTGQSIAM